MLCVRAEHHAQQLRETAHAKPKRGREASAWALQASLKAYALVSSKNSQASAGRWHLSTLEHAAQLWHRRDLPRLLVVLHRIRHDRHGHRSDLLLDRGRRWQEQNLRGRLGHEHVVSGLCGGDGERLSALGRAVGGCIRTNRYFRAQRAPRRGKRSQAKTGQGGVCRVHRRVV